MDLDIEIPEYFICPISLQIMKDPVTAITGITYDRRSIEHWIFESHNSTCPVTKSRLPPDSDLTPNHTLRRLIQAWCNQNASRGVDRIPDPKPPLTRLHVNGLLRDLRSPSLQRKALRQLELLAAENDRNRKHMAEAGTGRAVLSLIGAFYDEFGSRGGHVPEGVEEAVSILNFVRIPSAEKRSLLEGDNNNRVIESLTWILSSRSENHGALKSHAVCVIKKVLEAASPGFLERLEPGFFARIVAVLRDLKVSQQGVNAALWVMLYAGPWGRNRVMMVDAGAVFELVELELRSPEENKRTELVLGVLFHLCSCADGRAALVSHGAGIAVVAKKILRVSPTADERAILILSLICKHSCNQTVSKEMLKVGAVMKLFAVLQVGCAAHLKSTASGIIRSHYEEWKSSPCIGNSHLVTNLLR